MRICLYSPYLPDHFGGGEKHFFDTANALANKNKVYIAIRGENLSLERLAKIKKNYQERFPFRDGDLTFIATPLGTQARSIKKLLWTAHFDALYYVTDGSLFFSLARKNFLHIQIPFTCKQKGLINRLKLANWLSKNANSFFTRGVVEKSWRTKIDYVLQPGINTRELAAGRIKKEKIILNVGRFFSHLHSKKQDIMVNFFRDLCDKYPEIMAGWKLVLIGPIEDLKYAQKVSLAAKGYPIEIIHNANNEQVRDWYKRSSIYWHATGFGQSEIDHPERMEHFGITTLEAMAAGCVPIVIKRGGQPEVLGRKLQDCLWETQAELEKKTLMIIKKPHLAKICREAAVIRARSFSLRNFNKKVGQILENRKSN